MKREAIGFAPISSVLTSVPFAASPFASCHLRSPRVRIFALGPSRPVLLSAHVRPALPSRTTFQPWCQLTPIPPERELENFVPSRDHSAMLRSLFTIACCLAIALPQAAVLSAQEPRAQGPTLPPATAAAPTPNYPDSTSGLEHLVKDIIKAQSQNDGARADALLKTMILPNPHDWYEQTFDPEAAAKVGDYYQKAASSVPPFLASAFLNAKLEDLSKIKAVRFEHSCDDAAAEGAYGILLRRRQPVPIYELRFINGDEFFRVFPIAYVDGAFRFLLAPDFQPPAPPIGEKDSHTAKSFPREQGSSSQARIAVSGASQAAKLIHRVQPIYPPKAREENVSGTVKIHVVIGKDGTISKILAVNGVCSLAESAVAAVRQWRYSPTLINGQAVEVDTEINVIFSLSFQP